MLLCEASVYFLVCILIEANNSGAVLPKHDPAAIFSIAVQMFLKGKIIKGAIAIDFDVIEIHCSPHEPIICERP